MYATDVRARASTPTLGVHTFSPHKSINTRTKKRFQIRKASHSRRSLNENNPLIHMNICIVSERKQNRRTLVLHNHADIRPVDLPLTSATQLNFIQMNKPLHQTHNLPTITSADLYKLTATVSPWWQHVTHRYVQIICRTTEYTDASTHHTKYRSFCWMR